jgi:hypothetical protein
MTPPNAEVFVVYVRHGSRADAVDVVCTETSDASSAQFGHVTSTNVTHVASGKGAHAAPVASAKATAHTASATPSLSARGKKAAGQ